jgi:hypothetical protein
MLPAVQFNCWESTRTDGSVEHPPAAFARRLEPVFPSAIGSIADMLPSQAQLI